jgi:hypothetical protein
MELFLGEARAKSQLLEPVLSKSKRGRDLRCELLRGSSNRGLLFQRPKVSNDHSWSCSQRVVPSIAPRANERETAPLPAHHSSGEVLAIFSLCILP